MTFRLQAHRVAFDPIARLQIVQVQPTVAKFDSIDYAARRTLFRSVFDWMTAGVTSAELIDGKALSKPWVPRPQPPRVVMFPELYVPAGEFLRLANEVRQGQQVICGGIVPDPNDPGGSPFFSASAIDQFRQTPGFEIVANKDFVERVRQRVATHGNKANLAATLTVDRRGQPRLIIHAKVTPSQYEQHQRFSENTLGIDEIHRIELCWTRPRGSRFVILPLICSDFVLRHETAHSSLLRVIADRFPPVDLVCVLSVQPCYPSACPPWPREYQLATLDVAEQRIHRHFDRAHTTMTNVGSYVVDKKRIAAGYSFVSLQNGPKWEPYKRPLVWDGTTWYFGKFNRSNEDFSPGYCWLRREGTVQTIGMTQERHVGALLTHSPVTEVAAVLQHFELSLARDGEDAWQFGRILLLKNGTDIEDYNG